MIVQKPGMYKSISCNLAIVKFLHEAGTANNKDENMFLLLSCIKHITIIQLENEIIIPGLGSFIHLTLSDCCEFGKFKFY